jgi:hypothetical protein
MERRRKGRMRRSKVERPMLKIDRRTPGREVDGMWEYQEGGRSAKK